MDGMDGINWALPNNPWIAQHSVPEPEDPPAYTEGSLHDEFNEAGVVADADGDERLQAQYEIEALERQAAVLQRRIASDEASLRYSQSFDRQTLRNEIAENRTTLYAINTELLDRNDEYKWREDEDDGYFSQYWLLGEDEDFTPEERLARYQNQIDWIENRFRGPRMLPRRRAGYNDELDEAYEGLEMAQRDIEADRAWRERQAERQNNDNGAGHTEGGGDDDDDDFFYNFDPNKTMEESIRQIEIHMAATRDWLNTTSDPTEDWERVRDANIEADDMRRDWLSFSREHPNAIMQAWIDWNQNGRNGTEDTENEHDEAGDAINNTEDEAEENTPRPENSPETVPARLHVFYRPDETTAVDLEPLEPAGQETDDTELFQSARDSELTLPHDATTNLRVVPVFRHDEALDLYGDYAMSDHTGPDFEIYTDEPSETTSSESESDTDVEIPTPESEAQSPVVGQPLQRRDVNISFPEYFGQFSENLREDGALVLADQTNAAVPRPQWRPAPTRITVRPGQTGVIPGTPYENQPRMSLRGGLGVGGDC